GFTGTQVQVRNVISGNLSSNVVIGAADDVSGSHTANNNLIAGNFIGTNPGGTAAQLSSGQTPEGVLIQVGTPGSPGASSASNNLIGGAVGFAGNVISGNVNGVVIFQANGNSVKGNFIGTDLNGTAAVANTK